MLELIFQTLGTCLTLNETLPASGITAIFGVSGGKTSLINAISGLTRPAKKDTSRCEWRVLHDAENGICLTPEKRRIGYVSRMRACSPITKYAVTICATAWRKATGQFDKLVCCWGRCTIAGGLSGGSSA